MNSNNLKNILITGMTGIMIMLMANACTDSNRAEVSDASDPMTSNAAKNQQVDAEASDTTSSDGQSEPLTLAKKDITSKNKEVKQSVPSLSVVSMTISSGVKDRDPIDTLTEINLEQGQIFTHTAVKSGKAQRIFHIYKYQDIEIAKVALAVGESEAWRTWSSKKLHPTWVGKWTIEVRSDEDLLLASKELNVVSSHETMVKADSK